MEEKVPHHPRLLQTCECYKLVLSPLVASHLPTEPIPGSEAGSCLPETVEQRADPHHATQALLRHDSLLPVVLMTEATTKECMLNTEGWSSNQHESSLWIGRATTSGQ